MTLAGSQAWPGAGDHLRRDLAEIFADPKFQHAIWGVQVESVDRGDVLFALNSHKLLIPASNMKLLVGAAALGLLCPDFSFKTELLAAGPIREGVLRGSLVVRGGGDPSIGGRFHKNDLLFTFREWAHQLRRKGIHHIEGDIIGDDNLFDDVPYGQGWQWDDLPYWYAAEISALSFNDNCIDLLIEPGSKVGLPAAITVAPQTDYVRIRNKTVTVRRLPRESDTLKEIVFRRSDKDRVIFVEGPVLLKQRRFQEWASVPNPTLFTVSVFKEVLRRESIKVSGQAIDIDDLPEPLRDESFQSLLVESSPPLSKLLPVLLGRSQNLYGEMLLKYLGAAFGDRGTAKAGTQVVGDYLRRVGIPDGEFVIADGSGLSRENLVTPAVLCALLKAMAKSPHAEVLKQSLPRAGEKGTLAHRMKTATTRGRVWAKTGSIGGVRSLSGYILSQEEELFVFSFIVNNDQSEGEGANRLQDKACRLIAGLARGDSQH